MTATGLLERQAPNAVPERGEGQRVSYGRQGVTSMGMFRKTQHIHLVGIGGAGMSGIAEVLLTMG